MKPFAVDLLRRVGERGVVRGIWAVAFAVLATGVSGCIGGDAASSIDAPRWSSGFAYSYIVTGTVSATVTADGETVANTGPVGPATVLIEVLNTAFIVEGEPVYVAVAELREARATGNQPDVSLLAIRQRDLAEVPVTFDAESASLSLGPNPGSTFLDFPLRKGKTWSGGPDDAEADFRYNDLETEVVWDRRAEVVGPTELTLPVGRVQTLRVDFAMEPANLEAWMNEVREKARRDDAKLSTLEYAASARLSVYYSDDYQAVVREEGALIISFHIAGMDSDGEALDVSVRTSVEWETALAGARLVPKEERGLDYVANVLPGRIPVADPTGAAYRPAGYRLYLEADKEVVNAAESELVNFAGRLIGVDALPPGHQAVWRITDLQGRTVAHGEGLAFSYAFDEPGVYAVEVETREDDGAAVAADGTTLVANYEARLPVECPAVAAEPYLDGCPSVPVPVRLGVQSLRVEALPQSPVEPLNRGELRLMDPQGRTEAQRVASDERYAIALNDFSGWSVTDEDWTLQWHQSRAVLEEVEYKIILSYGGPWTDPAGEATESSGLDLVRRLPSDPVEDALLDLVGLPISLGWNLSAGELCNSSEPEPPLPRHACRGR